MEFMASSAPKDCVEVLALVLGCFKFGMDLRL